MPKSTFARNNCLDLHLGDVPSGYTRPAKWDNILVKLHTGDPGLAGTDNAVSTDDYTPKSVANNSTNFPAASAGAKSNGTAIRFAAFDGPVTGISHFSYWAGDDSECLRSGALGASRDVEAGYEPEFAIGALDSSET